MQEKMIDDLTSLTCAFIACILLVTGSPGPAQPLPVVHPRTAKGILQAQCKAYGGIGALEVVCNEAPDAKKALKPSNRVDLKWSSFPEQSRSHTTFN